MTLEWNKCSWNHQTIFLEVKKKFLRHLTNNLSLIFDKTAKFLQQISKKKSVIGFWFVCIDFVVRITSKTKTISKFKDKKSHNFYLKPMSRHVKLQLCCQLSHSCQLAYKTFQLVEMFQVGCCLTLWLQDQTRPADRIKIVCWSIVSIMASITICSLCFI